jgi:hypothetical protein
MIASIRGMLGTETPLSVHMRRFLATEHFPPGVKHRYTRPST